MKKNNQTLLSFYSSDKYIEQNPKVHTEDTAWKFEVLKPALDILIQEHKQRKNVRILDVGGGAGLLFRKIGDYLSNSKLNIEKHALDLSPGMLRLQKENNPDISKLHNIDVTATTFSDKYFDIILLIDVLEHLPDPSLAIQEIGRISHYTVIKVPLEKSFFISTINILTLGKFRKNLRDKVGHINLYNNHTLLQQVQPLGEVLKSYFTNSFLYYQQSGRRRGLKKFANLIGIFLHRISPRLASSVVMDFKIVLVKNK